MTNSQIRDFYFGSNRKNGRYCCTVTPNFGSLECRMNCKEWSDGKLNCMDNFASVVQLSQKSGRYIWYSDYMAECTKEGLPDKATRLDFNELQEAYHQFEYGGCDMPENNCYRLLMEIIHAYNDKYHRYVEDKTIAPVPDYKFFVQCVINIMKVGKNRMPNSLKAELYREAGMFSKCFEFKSNDSRNKDEMEILDEVLFRAAHGETEPFVIETCEYCKNNLRLTKRRSCPYTDC